MSRGVNPSTSPHSVGDPPTRVRWQILLLVMALCFAGHFSRIAMAVAGEERITKEYGFTNEQIGLVYSAFLATYTLVMIPGGALIDYIGTRRALGWMGMGLGLFTFITGAIGLISAPAAVFLGVLITVRSLMGIVAMPLHPSAARTMGTWFPVSQRTLANGIVTATALIAIASAYIIFGWMVSKLTWPWAFMVTGPVIAVVALAWFAFATDSPQQHPHVNSAERVLISDGAPIAPPRKSGSLLSEWGALFANRNVVLLTISYAAVGYFQYMFFYWSQHYFKDVLKSSDDLSRIYSSITTLSMAAGMFGGGWIVDWLTLSWGPRWARAGISVVGMLASAACLWLGVFATNSSLVVMWFSLALFTLGTAEGAFWATIVEVGGARGGAAAGILNFGGNAGGMIAPWLTPLVGDKYGWTAGLSVGAVACIIGAVLWLWVDPVSHKPLSRREAEEEAAEAVPEPL